MGKRIIWNERARADLRAIDRETALHLLPAGDFEGVSPDLTADPLMLSRPAKTCATVQSAVGCLHDHY
jgi:hypothetical protein